MSESQSEPSSGSDGKGGKIVLGIISFSVFLYFAYNLWSSPNDKKDTSDDPPSGRASKGEKDNDIFHICPDGTFNCLFRNNSCVYKNCKRDYTGIKEKIERCNRYECFPCSSPGISDIDNSSCIKREDHETCVGCFDSDYYIKCSPGYQVENFDDLICAPIYTMGRNENTEDEMCDTQEINKFINENSIIFNGNRPFYITEGRSDNILKTYRLNPNFPVEINKKTKQVLHDSDVKYSNYYHENIFEKNKSNFYDVGCNNGKIISQAISSPQMWEYYCKKGDLDNFKYKNSDNPIYMNLILSSPQFEDIFYSRALTNNNNYLDWNILADNELNPIIDSEDFRDKFRCKNDGEIMLDKTVDEKKYKFNNDIISSPICNNEGLKLPFYCASPSKLLTPNLPEGYGYVNEASHVPLSYYNLNRISVEIDGIDRIDQLDDEINIPPNSSVLEFTDNEFHIQCSSPYYENYDDLENYGVISYKEIYDNDNNKFSYQGWSGCSKIENCNDYANYLYSIRGNISHVINTDIDEDLDDIPCNSLEGCEELCDKTMNCEIFNCSSPIYNGRKSGIEQYSDKSNPIVSKNTCCQQKSYYDIVTDPNFTCNPDYIKITEVNPEFINYMPNTDYSVKPDVKADNIHENLKEGYPFQITKDRLLKVPMCIDRSSGQNYINYLKDTPGGDGRPVNFGFRGAIDADGHTMLGTLEPEHFNEAAGCESEPSNEFCLVNYDDYNNSPFNLCLDSSKWDQYKCETIESPDQCSSPCMYDYKTETCNSTIPLSGERTENINGKEYTPVHIKFSNNVIMNETGLKHYPENYYHQDGKSKSCNIVTSKFKVGDEFYTISENIESNGYNIHVPDDPTIHNITYTLRNTMEDREILSNERERERGGESQLAEDLEKLIELENKKIIDNINRSKFIKVDRELLKDGYIFCDYGIDLKPVFPINPPERSELYNCDHDNIDDCNKKPYCHWQEDDETASCELFENATCKYFRKEDSDGYTKRDFSSNNILRDYSIVSKENQIYKPNFFNECEYEPNKGYFDKDHYNNLSSPPGLITKYMNCEKNESIQFFRKGDSDLDNMLFTKIPDDFELFDRVTGLNRLCDNGYELRGWGLDELGNKQYYCIKCPDRYDENFNYTEQVCGLNEEGIEINRSSPYTLDYFMDNREEPEIRNKYKYQIKTPETRMKICKPGKVYKNIALKYSGGEDRIGECVEPSCIVNINDKGVKAIDKDSWKKGARFAYGSEEISTKSDEFYNINISVNMYYIIEWAYHGDKRWESDPLNVKSEKLTSAVNVILQGKWAAPPPAKIPRHILIEIEAGIYTPKTLKEKINNKIIDRINLYNEMIATAEQTGTNEYPRTEEPIDTDQSGDTGQSENYKWPDIITGTEGSPDDNSGYPIIQDIVVRTIDEDNAEFSFSIDFNGNSRIGCFRFLNANEWYNNAPDPNNHYYYLFKSDIEEMNTINFVNSDNNILPIHQITPQSYPDPPQTLCTWNPDLKIFMNNYNIKRTILPRVLLGNSSMVPNRWYSDDGLKTTYKKSQLDESNVGYYYNYSFDQPKNQQVYCSGNKTALKDKCYNEIIKYNRNFNPESIIDPNSEVYEEDINKDTLVESEDLLALLAVYGNSSELNSSNILDYQPSPEPLLSSPCDNHVDIGTYNKDECLDNNHIWIKKGYRDIDTNNRLFGTTVAPQPVAGRGQYMFGPLGAMYWNPPPDNLGRKISGYCIESNNPFSDETIRILLDNDFDPELINIKNNDEIPDKFKRYISENKNNLTSFITQGDDNYLKLKMIEGFGNIEGFEDYYIYNKLVDYFHTHNQKKNDIPIAKNYDNTDSTIWGESSPAIIHLDGDNYIKLKGNYNDSYSNWIDDFKECGWEADLENVNDDNLDNVKNMLSRKCNRLFYYGTEYDTTDTDLETPLSGITLKSSPIQNTVNRFKESFPYYSRSVYFQDGDDGDPPSTEQQEAHDENGELVYIPYEVNKIPSDYNKLIKGDKLPSFCTSRFNSESKKLKCSYNIIEPRFLYENNNENNYLMNEYNNYDYYSYFSGENSISSSPNLPQLISQTQFETNPGKLNIISELSNEKWDSDLMMWGEEEAPPNPEENYNTMTKMNTIIPVGICPGYKTSNKGNDGFDNITKKNNKNYNTFDSPDFKLKNGLNVNSNFSCVSKTCYVNESNSLDTQKVNLEDTVSYLFNSNCYSSPSSPNPEEIRSECGCLNTKPKYGSGPQNNGKVDAGEFRAYLDEVLPWPIIRAQSYLSCGGGLQLNNVKKVNMFDESQSFDTDPIDVVSDAGGKKRPDYLIKDKNKEYTTCYDLNVDIFNAWYYSIANINLDASLGDVYPVFTIGPPDAPESKSYTYTDPTSTTTQEQLQQNLDYKIFYFESILCALSWGGYDVIHGNERYLFLDEDIKNYLDNGENDAVSQLILPNGWKFIPQTRDDAIETNIKTAWVKNRISLKTEFEKNLKFISPTGFCNVENKPEVGNVLSDELGKDYNSLWWPLNGPNRDPLPGNKTYGVTLNELWRSGNNILTKAENYNPYTELIKQYGGVSNIVGCDDISVSGEFGESSLGETDELPTTMRDQDGHGNIEGGCDIRYYSGYEAEDPPTTYPFSDRWMFDGNPIDFTAWYTKAQMNQGDERNRIILKDPKLPFYGTEKHADQTYANLATKQTKDGPTQDFTGIKKTDTHSWYENYYKYYTELPETGDIKSGDGPDIIHRKNNRVEGKGANIWPIPTSDGYERTNVYDQTGKKYSCQNVDNKYNEILSESSPWNKYMQLKTDKAKPFYDELFQSDVDEDVDQSDLNWFRTMKPWLGSQPPTNILSNKSRDVYNHMYNSYNNNEKYDFSYDIDEIKQSYQNEFGKSNISTIVKARNSRFNFNCIDFKENELINNSPPGSFSIHSTINPEWLISSDSEKYGKKKFLGYSEVPLPDPTDKNTGYLKVQSGAQTFKNFVPPGFSSWTIRDETETGNENDANTIWKDKLTPDTKNYYGPEEKRRWGPSGKMAIDFVSPDTNFFDLTIARLPERRVSITDPKKESLRDFSSIAQNYSAYTTKNTDLNEKWKDFIFEEAPPINFNISNTDDRTRKEIRKDWLNLKPNYNYKDATGGEKCINPISYQKCNYDEECEGLCIKDKIDDASQVRWWTNSYDGSDWNDWWVSKHKVYPDNLGDNAEQGICQFGGGSNIRKLPDYQRKGASVQGGDGDPPKLGNTRYGTGGWKNVAYDGKMDKFCSINTIDLADKNPRMQEKHYNHFQTDITLARTSNKDIMHNKQFGKYSVFNIKDGPGKGNPCQSFTNTETDKDKKRYLNREMSKKCLN